MKANMFASGLIVLFTVSCVIAQLNFSPGWGKRNELPPHANTRNTRVPFGAQQLLGSSSSSHLSTLPGGNPSHLSSLPAGSSSHLSSLPAGIASLLSSPTTSGDLPEGQSDNCGGATQISAIMQIYRLIKVSNQGLYRLIKVINLIIKCYIH